MARQGFLAQVAELMSLTLASRCLGLVRDLALAWVIGVGPLADCLAQTLRLPHAFRRLLGEGIFSLNLTTAFIEHRAKIAQSIDQVKRQDYCVQGLYLALKGQLRRLLGPFFVGLFLLWAFLASVGFGSPGLLSQEFWLWALTLPYLFCLSLTALPMAYLHAQGVFRPSALAPLLSNIMMLTVLGLAFFCPNLAPLLVVLGLAITGLAQYLWQDLAAQKLSPSKDSWKKLDCSAALSETYSKVANKVLYAQPQGLLAASAQHLALLLALFLLSELGSGYASAFMYAERIYELPLALIGVCLGTASLPALGQAATGSHLGRLPRLLGSALHQTWLLILAATAGLWAVGACLIALCFGHGQVGALGVALISELLGYLLPLLPLAAVNRVLLGGCLATGGQRFAFFGTLGLGLGILVLSLLGLHPLGAVLLGFTLWTLALFLWLEHYLNARGLTLRSKGDWPFLFVAGLAALSCGLAARFFLNLGLLFLPSFLALIFAVLAGIITWLSFWRLFGAREFFRLWRRYGSKFFKIKTKI